MYTIAVRRDFIARHALIGHNLGVENFPNSHHYVLELQLSGSQLEEHGYLVDILDVEKQLDEIVAYYRDQMLNKKPEFAGVNPSLENFARILCTAMSERLPAGNVQSIKVVLREDESVWAAFELQR